MTIQSIARIETHFGHVIELLQIGKEFCIDSRAVAPNIGIEHESLLRTLETYQTELEHFGVFRFEIGKPIKGSLGGRPSKYAMLNRNQALFAITLSRNTEQVVQWKMALIDALDQLEKQHRLTSVNSTPRLPRTLQESAREQAEWEAFLLAWQEKLGSTWVTAREIANDLLDALPVDIQAHLKQHNFVSYPKIGKQLYSRVGLVYGNICIQKRRDAHRHQNLWQIQRTQQTS